MQALIQSIPVGMILINRDERIESLNKTAETIVGRHTVGRHYVTVLRQPGLLDAVERCLKDGSQQTTRYSGHESGQESAYQVTCSAIEAESESLGVLVSFEDVTALESADQMRRDFVANVSHELRTPLTALLGFVETLRGAARDDAAARDRFLGIMEREAERMNRLVGDLLSLSRVESDERLRPTEEVDACAVLRSTVQTLRAAAEEKNVTVTLKIPDTGVPVPGDADQLQQVFLNLIENAIKYGGAGKPVEICVEQHDADPILRGPSVRITVRDHGDGISAKHIPRLTQRFYRIDNHRSRELGGTGLGLAIVKHIVSRHRGRLRIESTPGDGSRFIVILPALVA